MIKHLYKLVFLFSMFFILASDVNAQGTISVPSGSYIVAGNGSYMVLNDTHMTNNGSFSAAGTSTVTFTGSTSVTLGGTGSTTFDCILLDKGAGTLTLTADIDLLNTFYFQTGLFNLGDNVMHLQTTGVLANESETSRATTTGNGYVESIATLNAPSSANPGNLEAIITSANNLGSTIVRRGHKVFSNVSGSNPSIMRYYGIAPANNSGLNATLQFKYFDAELNGLNEATLGQWKTNNNITWNFQGCNPVRDPIQNYVEVSGIGTLTRTTLSVAVATATATITGNQTVCQNDATQVTFTGANGTAPYTFTYSVNGGTATTATTSGGNATATVSQSTAIAGTFTYTLMSVQDASGCTQTQTGTATIQVNQLPTATIAGTATVCAGTATQLVTFTGAGGTAPYTFTYKINNGSNQTVSSTGGNTTATVNQSTAAGTYTYTLVSVQDASSTACLQAQTGTVTIQVNSLPTATIAGTATACAGTATQVVTFTGANGTPPYTFTYKINNGSNQTVTSAGGSTATVTQSTVAGTYTYTLVSVQDASSTACSQAQTGTVTIQVNALPTATFSGTTSQTICSGATATFTATLTGSGNYTITYQYSNGTTATSTTVAVSGSTLTITVPPPTAAGTYSFTITSITDSNGCSNAGANTATLTIRPLPTATISGNTIVCLNSTPQPAVTLTGAVGPPPYTFTYQVNGGTSTTVTTSGSNTSVTVTQSTAIAGTYTYTLISVSDANSCSQPQTGTATIQVIQKITGILGNFNVTCNGGNNGSINVSSVAGGLPPITFSKDGVNYISQPSSGPTFPNLAAGIYNIYAKDALGCTWPLGTATITQPTPIITTVTQGAPATCSSPSTTLTVSASGGTPGYSFAIDGGAFQPGNVFTAGIGNHTIAIKDGAGCTTTTTVTVSGTSSVSFGNITVTDNTCFGGISGQISVGATGAGTISYTLSAPGGTQTAQSALSGNSVIFTGLAAGSYTITASDNNNCPTVTTATISQPSVVMAPGNSNGAPDLLLTSVINPPTATFTAGGVVTITYTISVKNNSNVSAQGIIIRVTKPFSGYVITVSGNAWNKIMDNSAFAEFQLKAGLEIPCLGSMTAGMSIARAGMDSQSPGLPITATVRMPGANQDNHDQDNARASQFRVQ